MKQNSNSPISLPVPVKSWLAVLPLLFLIPAVPAAPVPPVLPAPTIVERGPHSKTWQTVRAVQKGDQTILRTNSYQELGMGISYLQKGVWIDSQEVITVVNGQGVANQGLHQVVFSASIADSPAVTYTDPDGQIFRTRVLGIAYYDCTSGKSALLCETQPSVGQVQGNQVIYTNA